MMMKSLYCGGTEGLTLSHAEAMKVKTLTCHLLDSHLWVSLVSSAVQVSLIYIIGCFILSREVEYLLF